MRTTRVHASLVLALAALGLGCTTPPKRPAPDLRAPHEAPPLDREHVLALTLSTRYPERAIQALESRRLGFSLDRANVEWLRSQGAAPEVVLYLKQRANAEWRDRKAESADAPDVESYSAPSGHGGDGDFAGATSAFGDNGVERGVYVRGTPETHLRHALSKAPGPEPFPHPELEPPLPPPERNEPELKGP